MCNSIPKQIIDEQFFEFIEKITFNKNLNKKIESSTFELLYQLSKDYNSKGQLKNLDSINDDDLILDIGEKTIDSILKIIDSSKTVLWNGPAGYFEVDEFSKGSEKIANRICYNTKNKTLISIAGGGDTVAAINKFGSYDGFTYISTAGGAFLESLEGKVLPGIKALEKNE